MAADEGVPVAALSGLNPGHVHLHEGGATPLACLEEDEAYGAAGEAVVFEHGEDLALGRVEGEGYDVTGEFVLDADAAHGPVFEVVAAAQALPGVEVAPGGRVFRVGGHCLRYECGASARGGDGYAHALTAGTDAR